MQILSIVLRYFLNMQRYKFGIKIMKNLFIEYYEPMFNKAEMLILWSLFGYSLLWLSND